jgi:hypothetical protein
VEIRHLYLDDRITSIERPTFRQNIDKLKTEKSRRKLAVLVACLLSRVRATVFIPLKIQGTNSTRGAIPVSAPEISGESTESTVPAYALPSRALRLCALLRSASSSFGDEVRLMLYRSSCLKD